MSEERNQKGMGLQSKESPYMGFKMSIAPRMACLAIDN